jgi:hypothetical protein
VAELAPLQLIFDQPLALIVKRFEAFLSGHDDCSLDVEHQQVGAPTRIQVGCLGFELVWSEGCPDLSGFRTVFTHACVPSESTVLSIDIGPNLNGGQRSPPIASALLAFGAKLANALGSIAVKWNPGKLVSDPAFFVECVESYIKGGAFPVLVSVDFDFSDGDSRLQSTGLEWFSGQEIDLSGGEFRGQELVRRAVRLVHDIATNGPVFEHQFVPDIDPAYRLELSPQPDDVTLLCRIAAKSDQKSGVSGMC